MRGCLAPSEIPGVSSNEASLFGNVAEEIIYADFCSRNACMPPQVFFDDHNPAGYHYFLRKNNPRLSHLDLLYLRVRTREEGLWHIPDILVHRHVEKAFYEIKPNSKSGLSAGATKVGRLSAIYQRFGLPYLAGTQFTPRDYVVASLGTIFNVKLKVQRAAPGLIVYRLCVDSAGVIKLATLIIILRFIVKQIISQRGKDRFIPVDLRPIFARNIQLEQLARTLGIATVAGTAATASAIGWKYFWKAVVKRFAVRAGTAATLTAADGPLPVGDLIAAGLALWTIVDIIRLKDQIWKEAKVIADNEA